MDKFEIIRDCELTKGPETFVIPNQFTEDNENTKLSFRVLKNGAAATLTGTVTAYAIRGDNASLLISDGTIADNIASIVLKSSVLLYNGPCVVSIRLTSGNQVMTLGRYMFNVQLTRTDTIIDPENVIPSIEQLLEQIAVMEAAIDRANDASDLCEKMTVSATAASGTTPTVTKTTVGDHYNLEFGLVPASISSQESQYAVSTSGTSIPSSGWSNSIPSVDPGKFLWTKHIITWGNSQISTIYVVSHHGLNGEGAVNSVNNVSPDNNGNVSLPIDNAPTENSDNPVKSSALKTILDGKAPLNSPDFTGSPTAPTQTAWDGSTKIATTEYVDNALLPFTLSDFLYVLDISNSGYNSFSNMYTFPEDGFVCVYGGTNGQTFRLYSANSNSYMEIPVGAGSGTVSPVKKNMRAYATGGAYTQSGYYKYVSET